MKKAKKKAPRRHRPYGEVLDEMDHEAKHPAPTPIELDIQVEKLYDAAAIGIRTYASTMFGAHMLGSSVTVRRKVPSGPIVITTNSDEYTIVVDRVKK